MKPIPLLLVAALLAIPAVRAEESLDLRSWEVLDRECGSEIGTQRITLFANGTIRLRIRNLEQPDRMLLEELNPNELQGYLNRLREIDLSESESPQGGTSGDWIEQCRLTLRLLEADVTDPAPAFYTFGRYDSLSLALARLVGIVDELAAKAEAEAITNRFPRGYQAEPGDILERNDGLLFEVIAYTSDQRGLELWGVDQPLVIYVLVEALIGEFVAVVEQRR